MTSVIWKSLSYSDNANSPRNKIDPANWQIPLHSHLWCPPTDLYEFENTYIARVEIAGMNQEDFSIKLEGNYLIISGIRYETHERRAYFQLEVRFGEFSTILAIPGKFKPELASAEYIDGFLTVFLPKEDVAKF